MPCVVKIPLVKNRKLRVNPVFSWKSLVEQDPVKSHCYYFASAFIAVLFSHLTVVECSLWINDAYPLSGWTL